MFKVEIIGYIGADARIVSTNGNEFVSFNVAHSEKRNDKEITTWVGVTTQNTKLAQYLTKGTKVFVRGNASLRVYQNEQHQAVAGINVFANEIEFCSSNNAKPTTPQVADNAQPPVAPPPADTDMPF